MSVTEYRTINKSAWQPGPWSDEPDKAQWYDEATGLPCLVVRGPCGALCGYVGVRPGHPWHGVEYDSVETVEEDEWGCKSPDVHGGLTFSAPCTHGADPATGICHIPAPGDTDNIWWLGFDCAHAGDYTDMKYDNAWRERFPPRGDVYRDYDYARSECGKLAKQAAQIAASADTLPKGQDAQQGLAGTESGAVAATSGETPNLHHSSTTPGKE
jgi:hypothetical protein